MDANPSVHHRDQKDRASLPAEVCNTERKLWSSINSQGLLHPDARQLYHQVCSIYETIILKDNEHTDLQEVEYSLWKLHYRHIDEFRKRIKKGSDCTNSETLQNAANAWRGVDDYMEGIKLFLLEGTDFYRCLVDKIRGCHGIPEDTSICRNSSSVNNSEDKKMRRYQFLCHRLLICLGDLARYRELYERPDDQSRNWSVAATHYLEASTIWPDSGNPHNQLALLATYIGDEFLAVYHCIRSLAVKEPFPDAWNNLLLLLEKSRSSLSHSHSKMSRFDFSRPSESRKLLKNMQSDKSANCGLSVEGCDLLPGRNLWHLFVHMISFFYIESSLEDFLRAFTSVVGELEALLHLDDIKIVDALKSYQFMDPARGGPFRAVQAVSIFIFVIQNYYQSSRNSEDRDKTRQLVPVDYALAAIFTFMDGLVTRSMEASAVDACPLLPAILVFVEWLANLYEEEELCQPSRDSKAAISSFFRSFVCLVNALNCRTSDVNFEERVLWEDCELRGFAPAARANVPFSFLSYEGNVNNYQSDTCRAHRIVTAAMKIAKGSCLSRWVAYDELGKEFHEIEFNGAQETGSSENTASVPVDPKEKDPSFLTQIVTQKLGKEVTEENSGRSFAVEEEEVILFNPLKRHNSAPLYEYVTRKSQSHEELMDHSAPPDDCLRRATSMLLAQSPANSEPSNFQRNSASFRHNKSFNQQETTFLGDLTSSPVSTGGRPPSLSAWVLNGGSLNTEKEKGGDLGKCHLPPIEEIATESLADLSIGKTKEMDNRAVSSCHESVITHYPCPAYSAPVPSAPLLPDDAVWFSDIKSSFSNSGKSEAIGTTENFLGASQERGYSNWAVPLASHAPSLGISGFNYVYPVQCGMTSSEWLRQFREYNNLHHSSAGQMWAPSFQVAGNTGGNFYHLGVPQLDRTNSWGTPLVSEPMLYPYNPPAGPEFPTFYEVDEPRKDGVFNGYYYRKAPYGCGAVMTEARDDQQMLLQYLKEREWRLQQDPNVRGPTF